MTLAADRIKGPARRRRQVAKPTVCKTVTHRFESGRRLHIFLALALVACSDPASPKPLPGPTDLPRWSEAPYVEWVGPSTPVTRPLAVFVDQPGGPLDLIAADIDVTTFLNDRFHPWFLRADQVDGPADEPYAFLLDARGCLRAPPFRPATPEAWIETANAALLAMSASAPDAGPLGSLSLGFPLPADHPLWGRCAGPAR